MMDEIGLHLTREPGEVPECPYCFDPLGATDVLALHLISDCVSAPDDAKRFAYNFAYPTGV